MPAHSLEQEAMDRVRRMYSSYERSPGENREENVRNERKKANTDVPVAEPKKSEHAEPPKPEPKPRENGGMLELLMKDKDQSLIMILLVILMKDGADMNILLALIYLLI